MISMLMIYKVLKSLRNVLFILMLLSIDSGVKSNLNSTSSLVKEIPDITELKYQNLIDLNLDFFITKHDYLNSMPISSKNQVIKEFLKESDTSEENKSDIFIFPSEIIFEEEEKYKTEILNNVIKKEVNIDEYKLNENADIYGFPDSKKYHNHPIKLLNNNNIKIKNFSEFPSKIIFEPKTLDIINK